MLTNTKNELIAEIENKTEELKNITSETEEMNNTISELTAKMDSLNLLAEEMQSEIKSFEEAKSIEVNSVHTDIKSGDNEYKGYNILDNTKAQEELSKEDEATVNAIIDKIIAEYPEWFSTDGNGGGSTTQPYQGEHVGTEDNTANTPQIQFDPSNIAGLSTDVTVY